MDYDKKTVFTFFDGTKTQYSIPVYQRAYSWEDKHWDTFYNDLLEQELGGSTYFFGTILVEEIIDDISFEIVDGQQRVTTIVIFIRSAINALRDSGEQLTKEDKKWIKEKTNVYLDNGSVVKLQSVDYDRAFFNYHVIADKRFTANTPSQQRILQAKSHFTQLLAQLPKERIKALVVTLEKAKLTAIKLKGKRESALMFELENNRGKDLTNMEKLKSYLMYQLYVNCHNDESENVISKISKVFEAIYQFINDITLISEDAVLYHHNTAYLNGYSYRTLDDLVQILNRSENKVAWITDYVGELHQTFSAIKSFEKDMSIIAKRLRRLKVPGYAFPFIIRAYKYCSHSPKDFGKTLEIVENVIFRAAIIRSRAKIQERLSQILQKFTGDTVRLESDIAQKLKDTRYWSDQSLLSSLNQPLYKNKALNYLLWQYEAHLQGKGYVVEDMSLTDEEIEHISPQTPTEENETLASGYEVNSKNKYDDEFEIQFLNSIGNLMLISKSHNSSIGNKPFKDKLQSYQKNPLLSQQREIESFATKEGVNNVWKSSSIIARRDAILKFTREEWFLSN